MTAGSFVLILAKSGTSLVVKVALSKVLTIAVKQSRVCTLIESILVFVNRICNVSARIRCEGQSAHRDVDQEDILYGPVIQNLAEVRDQL